MPLSSADEEAIFTEALEKGSLEERARFLDSACGHDAILRSRVDRLLGSHEGSPHFLQAPLAALGEEPFQIEKPGLVIGRYKLLEQIGEGGFGIVFMAEQMVPVRRTVAIKVLKPGMDSRQVIARFEAERQALALMDHPNIARVLDGGETPFGRPYLVMDLVQGVPITNFCAQQKLSARARLHLFLAVCEAVQHAHRKGIIHRDLKPSNVLGALQDSACVVKVIDFGIVKALGQQLTDNSASTSFANMIGTPSYMSPEQTAGNSSDIDTRSDIYSLGVLLYELLTGATPFDKQRLHAGYDEMRRIIREEEPPRPSQRLSTLANAGATLSMQPPGDAKQLSLRYQGELDWIVMKALEKDRNRRYDTAGAFAADLQRYLNDEPVEACPPSTWYRCRKFMRRNRAPVAVAGVLASALVFAIAAIAGSIGWALNDRAVREAAVDNEVQHALAEARTLIEQSKWDESEAALGRGKQLLAAAGRPFYPAHLLELQEDLGMVRRLEEVYGQSSDGIPGSNSVFGSFPSQKVDPIFLKAFSEYGIDLSILSVREAAERVGKRSIRLELARALDYWSSVLRRADEEEKRDWRRLLAIAKAADPDPWRDRLRDAIAQKDLKKLEQMAASVDERQTPPRSLLLLANALEERGARPQAALLLRKAQQQYPGDYWINDALGWSCHQTAPEEAVRCFTAALALRPDRWQSWKRKPGSTNTSRRQLDKAYADLSRAVSLNPANAEIWLARAASRPNSSENWNEMIHDTTMAISVDPGFLPAYLRRGEVYRKSRQWEQAIADYNHVLAIDNREYAWYFRGECHAALGQWALAAQDLDRSLQIKFRDRNKISYRLTPMRDEVWMTYCCYRAAAADSDGYRKACERFLAYYGETKKPLEACRIALSLFLDPHQAVAKDPSVRLAAFAVANAPQDHWCSLAQGAALHRTGQCAQAVQWLEQLERSWTKPTAAEAGPLIGWLYLALAHQQLGHAQQARSWLHKAVQRMDREDSTAEPGPLRLENNVWAMCLVLRREAEGSPRPN